MSRPSRNTGPALPPSAMLILTLTDFAILVARESIVAEGEKTYKEKRKEHLQKIADEMGLSLKQARKRERRRLNGQRTTISKRAKFPPCARCTQPAGQGCAHSFCKKCCRWTCKQKAWDCKAHRQKFSSIISESAIKEDCTIQESVPN
ncbi:hypothetical protein Y032_0011g1289 [Ancylostoma ceylanicum]|uniref:MYND-type domain-containing protein n=1 Tax=Ancylostoma ceylanicum TaxID=53326 RepID=A0A016VFT6_9BILA|nr:hypothetical protein Y032_0011g1289 [Ancylostoma ceylanicum]